MCNKAAQKDPCLLEFVPDCFKTQEMCSQKRPLVTDECPRLF